MGDHRRAVEYASRTVLELYKLAADGLTPLRCESTAEWGEWYSRADRLLAETDLGQLGDVSTLFLAAAYPAPNERPRLWQTLVFGGPLAGTVREYTAADAARAGHEDLVRTINARYAN